MKKLIFSTWAIVLIMMSGCTSDSDEPEESPNEEAEVEEETIDVDIVVDGLDQFGRVIFMGETNLPDHAELQFKVKGNGYEHETKGIVFNKAFESNVFSYKGEPLDPGTYELSINLAPPSQQDDRFLEVAGDKFENLTGVLMETSDTGKNLSFSNDFTVEEREDEVYLTSLDAKEIMASLMTKHDHLVELSVVSEEIKAVIDLHDDENSPDEELAVATYHDVSKEYLKNDGWETLTIEFVDIGTISMGYSEKESDDEGDYFSTEDIEKNFKVD